jgi:hypothetical protein
MSFTAITVVLVGILAAYAVVTSILYAFNYRSRHRASVTPAILVPQQSQASGD